MVTCRTLSSRLSLLLHLFMRTKARLKQRELFTQQFLKSRFFISPPELVCQISVKTCEVGRKQIFWPCNKSRDLLGCFCWLEKQWRSRSVIYNNLISGSPGLVVMGGDSCSEGCGFKSQCRILDGHDIFSHIFAAEIVMFVWKDENKWKRGRG